MTARLSFVLAALGLSLACEAAQEPPSPAPAVPAEAGDAPSAAENAAREIIATMAKAYAECSSYRDSGTVTTKFIVTSKAARDAMGAERTDHLAFKTVFVRNGSFRFEYADLEGWAANKPLIVSSDGKAVRTWWHVEPGVETASSLSMAIAGATGVSRGSAHTVPRLLLPEIRGWSLTETVEPRCAGEDFIDGRTCLKIVAKHPAGDPRTIWIDKESHLIRQLSQSHDHGDKGFRTEQTTSYAPEVNVTIDPVELEFNPPDDAAEDEGR